MRLVLPLLLAVCTLSFAQDVHVRVDPAVPHADPGDEDNIVFPTIQNALDHHPWPGNGGRVYIEIAPGTYRERVIVTQNHPKITLVGKGASPADVVITNSLNAKQAGGTFFTETVQVNGEGFEADNLTFENSAGKTGQAVAIAVRSDRAIFKKCRFLGNQDTLFADYGRQYYVDSYIEGNVDFIFGNAAAVFDHSKLHANGPGYLTAQSRNSPDQTTGYVILNSKVTADLEDDRAAAAKAGEGSRAPQRWGSLFLGRPWRPYSRVVVLNTELPGSLAPQGWDNWGKAMNEKTAFYAESGNQGPGATLPQRAKWSHQLNAAEAKKFLPARFLRGSDNWNPVAEAARLP